MKEPDTLEGLILLLKRHGVMHYEGAVVLDFGNEMEVEAAPEEAPAKLKVIKEPVDPATGLTKSQSDELFHSAE